MMKKHGIIRKIILPVTLVFTMTSCTQDAAAGPKGSAVSAFPQMMDVNKDLKAEKSEDQYRTTYEVFLYSFYDSDGDGVGDINGLIQKLDYIQDLGFNEIWLMPVSPSDTYHKYDVNDYCAIDEQYGTMDDFDNLIRECDERDIKVIIDLVLNHTSDTHDWFQKAHEYLKELPQDWEPSSEYCPYFDYYNFTKELNGGYAPLSDTTWYYEARFWNEMPDLNLDSQKVRGEIENIMRFWLEHGVAGFRLDAVTSYYTGRTDKNIEFLNWLVSAGRAIRPDCYFVGEAWTGKEEIAELYTSGIDSLFNFPFADSEGIIKNTVTGSYGAEDYMNAQKNADALYKASNPDYVDAPFYTNHDMGRSAGYYAGDDGTKTKFAGALNLLMSGNVFVYYGEELGMKGAGKDENKRAPMYWSKEQTEGMCKGPENMDAFNMKFDSWTEQKDDPFSIYNYYKQAILVRNAFPAIARGKIRPVEALEGENICAYVKHADGYQDVVIVINTGDEEEAVDAGALPCTNLAAVLNVSEEAVTVTDAEIRMPAYGIAVLTE